MSERPRWRRRSSAQAVIPVQRLPGVEVVDALTKLAHQVSPDELVTGHQRGDYLGLCGVRFPPASLVEPGRGRCRGCAS
ncbi:MAG: hypothetical protein ACRDSH_09695 [Pseudonocardiaceae bacterium]